MKIYGLIIIVAISLIPLSNFAQNTAVEISSGIRAGWHTAGMFRSGTQNFNNLQAFYVGFFSESRVSDNWSGGSGLEYFQNGFENATGNFKMHVISVPMYVKPQIGPVFGTAGLALNFKVSDNREDFPGQITDTKFFDLPLTLGAGVQLGPVIIEAKYYWGLFQAATINGSGNKNQYLQAGAAIMF